MDIVTMDMTGREPNNGEITSKTTEEEKKEIIAQYEDQLLMHPPEPEKIDKLNANEEIELYYYIRAKKDETNIGKTVGTKAVATIEGDSKNYESNQTSNTIRESKFQVDIANLSNSLGVYLPGTKVKLKIVAKNITDETMNNAVLKSEMTADMTYIDGGYMVYDSENKYY